jgi:hypothetical protein
MVRVEVLVVGSAGGRFSYRCVTGDLPGDRHPDALAADLALATGADAGADAAPLAVLHSTSWRFTDGTVVLTYAAVLDGRPGPGARPLPEHGIAYSTDPTAPTPPHVCADAVATHAARHLAWLRAHDEVVATALAARPDVWHALDRFTPTPAGSLPWPATVTA